METPPAMTKSSADATPTQPISPKSLRSWKRSLAITGAAIAGIYGAICAGLWFGQTKLVFMPTREITTTPAEFNAKYEDVWIPVQTETGTENIHGWWMPNAEQEKLNLSDRRVLLYLHGNGRNVGANAKHANRLKGYGFSVLLIDYRGYGKSEGGFPSETSVYTDAQTAWNYLIQKGYRPEQILIYGHSLGGAIAIDLAVKNPQAKGMIVDGSFTSISDLATREPKYRIFPIDLLINQRFDSIAKVNSLKTPVLYIHGTADEIIPASMGQKLYEATPSRKQIMLVPNAGHNNTASTNEANYANAVRSFFELR